MKDHKFNNRPRNGRSSYQGNSSDRYSDKPSMFNAVCSKCGKDCQVPFKPTGDRPIFCSDCFQKKDGRDHNSGGRSFDKGGFGKRDFGNSSGSNLNNQPIISLTEKIETLNLKLDTIINLLASAPKNKEAEVAQEVTKEKESAPVDIVDKKEKTKKTAPSAKPKAVKKSKK